MPDQRDLRLGERAGLVGAQHVHAAEVVDRAKALHDDLSPSPCVWRRAQA